MPLRGDATGNTLPPGQVSNSSAYGLLRDAENQRASGSPWSALQSIDLAIQQLSDDSPLARDLIGIAHLTRTRCLIDTGELPELITHVEKPRPAHFNLAPAKRRWMLIEGVRAALSLGEGQLARRLGRSALNHCPRNDVEARIDVASRVCRMMHQAGRPALNTAFAVRLIKDGQRVDRPDVLAAGLGHAMRNIRAAGTVQLMYLVAHSVASLDLTIPSRVKLAQSIYRADWFESARSHMGGEE